MGDLSANDLRHGQRNILRALRKGSEHQNIDLVFATMQCAVFRVL